MLISGIQKFTLLDYPEKIATIIFTAGCNFRCGFCYNREFVLPEEIEKIKDSFIFEDTVLNFLKTRVGKIDGVVISGGEPTLQKDLEDFIDKVKELGFLVKLDTNGTNPKILKKLVENKKIDFVAMDIKTDFNNYKNLVGQNINLDDIKESLEFLKKDVIPYEFRTTVVQGIHTPEVFEEMGKMLKGARKIYLQNFRSQTTLDSKFTSKKSLSKEELEKAVEILSKYIHKVLVRG
ncbi:MAG: anaerobic ribonucleoside-triphosphate reductase activating protein [Candidatus Moranbacteria bacterium]|nr:anaerobic ribonucleoside-triphosphate reductase activating protein [Candidatus Moranbacteria bacterium]